MFDYINQVNKRAKRIKLQFCAYRGLIISSPKKLSSKRLDNICIDNQQWIIAQKLKFPLKKSSELPSELVLLSLPKSYQLSFTQSDKTSLKEIGHHLHICANSQPQQLKKLKQWIRKTAQHVFAKRLAHWSQKTQLHYAKLSVRSQKSRWGSCSSTGTISLNDQLLFMPSTVLDYIIVHELCHTIEPNHSTRYWTLVEHHHPNFQQQEMQLAEYASKIPHWFRASLFT